MLEGYAYCRLFYEEGQAVDYVYVEVNSAFEKQTGLKNVVGKKVSEIIAGIHETNPEQLEIYSRVAFNGRPEQFETHTRALGIWFSVSVYSLNDEHFISVFDNITKRKLAEIAVRQSEERLRLITDLVPHCIFAKDAEGRHIFANRTLAEVHGLSVEEIIGKTDFDLVADPVQAAAYRADDLAVIQSGKGIFRQEEPMTDFAGQKRFLQTTKIPFTVAETGEPAVVGVWMDITERKRMESRFRRLVDSNVQGIYFWNTQGQITEANDAFLNLTRYTREDADNGRMSWREMTPPEYADRDQYASQQIADSGVCTTYEKEFICKDGTRVPILIGAAIFDDNPEEGVCFTIDLTERRKIEQHFQRAQRMESIGTLAGGIAHDLNNALAPIILSLSVLQTRFPDRPSQELLGIIKSSAERGADMVRQVLAFARGVEGRRMELGVKHLLQEIEKIARDTFPKNIVVRTIVPHDLWTVLGDPTQIHQVLLNLCVNARDAMPEGGNLIMSAENLTLDAQYAGMNRDASPGPHVLIQVEDTGTGIPVDVIEKIFDPFFTTKELGKGTGLGLSTSLSIVKGHGGFVRVYSEPGKGTKFRIYFPAQSETGEGAAAEPQMELVRGRGELILVVDDESSVRDITKKTLEAFGYRVVLASDGAEAVAVYATHGVDIAAVLTDMMMPGIDGAATIQVLRRMNPKLPIIAASGLSTAEQIADNERLGVKHFLTKPYTAESLLNVLAEILSKRP
jgi:PAS domain S-box-containing protein